MPRGFWHWVENDLFGNIPKKESMKPIKSLLVSKWVCFVFAVLAIQTAQSQTVTLTVVTNPPQGGTICSS
jgi:hypothetical protein